MKTESKGPSASAYLRRAVLRPEGRAEDLRSALGAVVRGLSAAGAALVRPSADGVAPWGVSYVGERERDVRRWLEGRL